MKQRRELIFRLSCSAALGFILPAQTANAPRAGISSVRVLFGLTDTEPARWDGTVTLDSGAVKSIQGWRFGPEDSTDYTHSWKASTRAQGNGPDNVLERIVSLLTAFQSLPA